MQSYVGVELQDTYPADWNDANLVGSRLADSELHAPAIDIDHPAVLLGRNLSIEVTPDDEDTIADTAVEAGSAAIAASGFASVVEIARTEQSGHRVHMELTRPAVLFPSRTEGHSHLYTEHVMTWDNYLDKCLRGMMTLGIVQKGFFDAAESRGMSHLRIPATIGQLSLDHAEFAVNP
jgi:hypothetical protein